MTDAPAPDVEPTALVLDISTEELSFLLRMVGVREIPGFTADTETDDLIESVVRHALSARGAIARNIDGDWMASDLVHAAITAGARANRYLTVRRDTRGTVYDDWLYVLPSVVVQYGRPADYIHRFQALFTPEALVESLAGLLDLAPPDPFEPAVLSFPATLLDVRRLAREGRTDEAQRAADAHMIPDDLRAALIAPEQYAALSALAVSHGRSSVIGGMAVTSSEPGRYWMLTPVGNAVHAMLADSSEVVRRVGDMLAG